MHKLALAVGSALALSACEFDTSKEHLVYCQNGGAFGCGHGTRMLMQSLANGSGPAAMGQFNRTVYPQAATPTAVNCTTTTMGQFTNTRCE